MEIFSLFETRLETLYIKVYSQASPFSSLKFETKLGNLYNSAQTKEIIKNKIAMHFKEIINIK